MTHDLRHRVKRCEIGDGVAYSLVIRSAHGKSLPAHELACMTILSPAQHRARGLRKSRRAHLAPLLASALIAAVAVGLVGYLLWPTWEPTASGNPDRLPVSVGGTVFNVPIHAFRMKVQKHSGPQERVDLNFVYPSLDTPEAPKHVSAETVEETPQPIDRIFLSVSAHRDVLAPDARLRTIYPRYFDSAQSPAQDGLTMRAFRDGTPYNGEDLFFAAIPNIVARCTRETVTPGMCLSERRIDGADLTFRFPRQWLTQWRDVAGAMDRLVVELHGPQG